MSPDGGGPGPVGSLPSSSGAELDAEYVRRVYERAMDWYKVAESKAQLILTVNGVLVTVTFSTAAGHISNGRDLAKVAGVETWCFFAVVVAALLGAVACAAACMWSRHGTNYKGTFDLLDVNPEDPASYRPEVLWYFGDLAHLQMGPAALLISQADRKFEITSLSYNVVHLARIVLRKHKFINAGWALTALGIASLILGGASIFVRAQI